MSMYGTDLNTAYAGTSSSSHQLTPPNIGSTPVVQNTPIVVDPPVLQEPIQYTPPPILSLEEIENHNAANARIKQLEEALTKQTLAAESSETLYDRYVSKKKDVFKLIAIALTILLAMSTNYVIQDLLKVYLMNNDFTREREIAVRVLYPLSILGILWSLKVFNR